MMTSFILFPFAAALAVGGLTWIVIAFVIFVLPFVLIIKKAGYSPLWILVACIPVLGYLFLWIFALSRWPVEDRRV